MKRLAPFLLLLLAAPAALAQSSTGALASARIVRPLATFGLTTSNGAIELSNGSQRVRIPVSADRVDLAVAIAAPPSVTVSESMGSAVAVSRTSPPTASRVVSITIHNR